MKIEIPKPQPRKDGEFTFYVTVGYGDPHGTIWLDEAQSLVLDYVDAEDCDRIIRAVAEVKSQVLAYRAEAAVPHGKRRVYRGTCQLCGKPEDDELHAEPKPLVISDSTIEQAKLVADDIAAGTWPPKPETDSADATRDQPASSDAAGVLAAAIAAGTPVVATDDEAAPLCHYCDVEPATVGDYCEACAPAVALATGSVPQ